MAYGQKNYADIQGINGKYRISQIGCFLTSFSNLLERFGRPVDPPTLNRIFRDRGIYIDVDDGIRDDLGWQSIVAYDGHVALERTGTGALPHRHCIVRIAANNSFGTHFCLVSHIDGGTVYVVDSWDGVVKPSSVYGPITGWAAYGDIKPQPVTPIGDKPMNRDEEANAYRIVLQREMEHGGSGRTGYKFILDADAELKAQRQAISNQVQALQTALANEQAKPPKEVIRTVTEIVEKIVEVQSPVDEEVVVKGWFKRQWDRILAVLFAKKS